MCNTWDGEQQVTAEIASCAGDEILWRRSVIMLIGAAVCCGTVATCLKESFYFGSCK